MQSNPYPSPSKAPNKDDVLARIQNSSTMPCNIIDHLHKMKVTLPIMEVMEIPQQKKYF